MYEIYSRIWVAFVLPSALKLLTPCVLQLKPQLTRPFACTCLWIAQAFILLCLATLLHRVYATCKVTYVASMLAAVQISVCFQVAVVNGDRLLGEEAAALKARYPDQVYSQARNLLGLPLGHSSFELPARIRNLPFKVAPDKARGAAQISSQAGDQLLAEELVVSMLL